MVLQVSDEEVIFLTGGDPKDDENNLKMFHPRCKLMLVTEGGEGCRYYTQVYSTFPTGWNGQFSLIIIVVSITSICMPLGAHCWWW